MGLFYVADAAARDAVARGFAGATSGATAQRQWGEEKLPTASAQPSGKSC